MGVATAQRATRVAGAPAPTSHSGTTDAEVGRRLGYVSGLDGLRGVALLAVMAFHSGLPRARGGYLGVSSFFTLSGFLIATLAVDEWRRTGRLSWRRFWERRARRLLPAALVALCAVLVLQAWREVGSGPRFRGDALAALGYVANWRQAAGDRGYAGIFSSPSPVVHFWSLAIEEQFYVLFPLVFAGVMALVGARLRRGALVFGAAALASFALAWLGADRSGNDGLTYYGTHTRAGELLVGVTLAYVVAGARGRARGRAGGRLGVAGLTLAGTAAVAVLAALWSSVAIGDDQLFHGVTLLNALATAVVIVAAVAAHPFDRALGVAPLRLVGKVSYGAYLFHWPIFLVLTADRTGLDGLTLFAVRTTVTLVVAAVSYLAIEAPIRFRLRIPRLRLAMTAAGAVAAVAALAVALPQHPARISDQAAPAADGGPGPIPNLRTVAAVAPEDGSAAAGTVLLAGDSMAWSLLPGVTIWNEHNPGTPLQIDTHIAFGCPAGGPGQTRVLEEQGTFPECSTWHDEIGAAISRSSPNLVVLLIGLADLGGRPFDGEWRPPGDPVHDQWLSGRLDELASEIEASGVPAVWLTFPHVRVPDADDPTRPWTDIPVNDPARADRYNDLVRATVAGHPGIQLVDLSSWVDTWPDGSFDPDDRDGVHFTFPGAQRVGEWLIPQLLQHLSS